MKLWPVLVVLLIVPLLACGLAEPGYYRNNTVRQAAFAYERAARGPVDELIIQANRDEPRVKFEQQHQDGGRTVWLFGLAIAEYFELLPPEKTYLFIRPIDYNDSYQAAEVTVYRGDGEGYTTYRLSLARQEGGRWVVTGETQLEETG